MATTKTVKVTVAPTLTGDTVASYNTYSSIDGLLGTLSLAEAAAGKDFSLSDGATHSITVKAVWTTAGETTTVGSNEVSVTTVGTTAPDISTAVYDAEADLTGTFTQILGFSWIDPTTKLQFDVIGNTDKITRYSVSIAGDIGSTVTFVGVSVKPSAFGSYPSQPRWSSDGLKCWVSTFTGATLLEFTLTTPYALAEIVAANLTTTVTLSNSIIGWGWNNDGTKFHYAGGTSLIYEVTVTTPYSLVGTITETQSFDTLAFSTGFRSNCPEWSSDGTKLYIGHNNTNALYEEIVTLDCSANPGTLTGAVISSPAETLDTVAHVNNHRQIIIHENGTRLWVVEDTGIITQWDIP